MTSSQSNDLYIPLPQCGGQEVALPTSLPYQIVTSVYDTLQLQVYSIGAAGQATHNHLLHVWGQAGSPLPLHIQPFSP